MNTAVKVGLFVLITAVVAAYLIITFDTGAFSKSKKVYYAYFDEAPGLSVGSDVSVKGIKAGKVENITLEDGKVKVKIGLNKDIQLYKNATVSIRTLGLMGDKYLYIDPGTPSAGVLASGGVISNTKVYATTEDAFESAAKLMNNINEAIGNGKLAKLINDIDQLAVQAQTVVSENRENLKKSIENIEAITASLKQTLPDLISKIETVADNLEKITGENRQDIRDIVKNLKETAIALKEKTPKTLEDIDSAAKEVKSTLQENRTNIKVSIDKIKSASEKLDEILAKINEGKGTLGKLVNEDSLYNNVNEGVKAFAKPFKILLDSDFNIYMYGEKHTGNKDTKAGFAVSLAPNYDRYIYLGLVSNSNGSVTQVDEVTQNGQTTRYVKKSMGVLFDAQYARTLLETKYGSLWVRAGLKESSGAGGLDWWFNKNIRITSDIYRFNRKYSSDGTNKPELDIGFFYKFDKYPLYLKFGGSDLIADKYRGVYVGAGLMFSDEYLKYMIGSLGSIRP
jgi:phospholipid/cholesterol/gamma-HCH transport system substrate-binding protein